jgi:SAM-dependent methyltransferase
MKPAGMPWREYARAGMARRLTELGQRWGIDCLVYNPFQMQFYHRLAVDDAPAVILALRSCFPVARRYADVGSGSGAYAAEARRSGLAVQSCERDRFGRFLARCQGVDCRAFDLNMTPPATMDGPFDLAYCFEVAEHLPELLGLRLVDFLCMLAPIVIFSAATPGQGGTGHINEREPDYWIGQFTARGFVHCPELTEALAMQLQRCVLRSRWLISNVRVFVNTQIVGTGEAGLNRADSLCDAGRQLSAAAARPGSS